MSDPYISDRDLIDVLKAITHTWTAIDVLTAGLPPEKAKLIAQARQGMTTSMIAILDRHDIPVAEDGHE